MVPAGHKLGKDFISGLIALVFFLTRKHCRVVTTSVDMKQLEGVLWGEMRNFIQTSRWPLDSTRGGPLVINHMHIRKLINGELDGKSYIIGRTCGERGEGLSGHHLDRGPNNEPMTLGMLDEASGIDPVVPGKFDEWAHSQLLIGNPYECQNDFKWAVKGRPGSEDRGGDIARERGGYHRKIIRITAADSPNVQFAEWEKSQGRVPSNAKLLPGVLTYDEYMLRRRTWDPVKQCAGLDADFWEGAEVLMFPPVWLNSAEERADAIGRKLRSGRGIGVDSARGGDKSAWCVVDEEGVIELIARKTWDTDVIAGDTLALARKYNVPWDRICFDAGGGGHEHAMRLRKMGYPVRTVAFGESVTLDLRAGRQPLTSRRGVKEERQVYLNRRAQLYGELRQRLDPTNGGGYAIPRQYTALRHQLAPIPLTYDQEGRLKLIPKHPDPKDPTKPCLTKLIGHSPDEADSLVLAYHAMVHKSARPTAGVA